ncbi:hypothetical protein LCGC14_0535070 [marine sediment metagenome]|uniref:Uncharacterized protein n=1 Tax=marine sediment metagenome TaxID=412755 RepID=A0A0F9RZ23_9ZZZZ
MKTKIMRTEDIHFDKSLYPRVKPDWLTTYKYSQSMRAGNKFPPIQVTNLDSKWVIIDGVHRHGAYTRNKVEHIEVEDLEIKDRDQAYMEAIKRNSTHGRVFTSFERVQIIVRLESMNVDLGEISKIVGMPLESMKKFKVSRITHTITGEEIVLKSAVRHMAGVEVSEEFYDVQKTISGHREQLRLLDMIIKMLKEGMFDLKNEKIVDKIEELRTAIPVPV